MEQKGASTVKRKTLLSLAILVLIIGGATSWLLLKAPKESYLKSNDLVGADEWKGVLHLIGTDYRLNKTDAERTLVVSLTHYKNGKRIGKSEPLATGLAEKKGDFKISFLFDQNDVIHTDYQFSLVNDGTITNWPEKPIVLKEKDQFVTDGTLSEKTAIKNKPVVGYAYRQKDNKRVLSRKDDAALIGKYNQPKPEIAALKAYDDLYLFTAEFKKAIK